MRARLVIFAFVSVVVCCVDARAQSVPEQARQTYAQAKAEFARGNYEVAIRLFRDVYREVPSPALLFNMAQAYRLLDQCVEASRVYKSYLSEEPEASNRREVEEYIETLEPCVKERTETRSEALLAKAPPSAATEDRPSDSPQRPVLSARGAAMVTTAVGAAVTTLGAGMYVVARLKFESVKDECPCEPGAFSAWEAATNASYVMLVAGAVTTAVGGVWWSQTSVGPPDTGTGAMLRFRAAF